jgi:hypothetical protein
MKRTYHFSVLLLQLGALFAFSGEYSDMASSHSFDGKHWKLVNQSSNIVLEKIETKHVTNMQTGAIGTFGRPGGLYRKEVFLPVCEVGGIFQTNRDLMLSMVVQASIPEMKIRDFQIESNLAIYICDTFITAKVTGKPTISAVIVTPSLGTNEIPNMSWQKLWSPRFSSFSDLKSVKMSGSFSKGDLSIEVIAIDNTYITTHTNRFISGKWVVTEGNSIPINQKQ